MESSTARVRSIDALVIPADCCSTLYDITFKSRPNDVFRTVTELLRDEHGFLVQACPTRTSVLSCKVSKSSPPSSSWMLHTVPSGTMQRRAAFLPLFSMMDVVFVYVDDSHYKKHFSAVLSHFRNTLIPLLVSAGVSIITIAEKEEVVAELTTAMDQLRQRGIHPKRMHHINLSPGDDQTIAVAKAVADYVSASPLAERLQTVVEGHAAASDSPCRVMVVRKFDKLAVLMCKVLQGVLRVGDRLCAYGNPLVTISNNRVVSLRAFPDNESVDCAFPGDHIGIMTEAQMSIVGSRPRLLERKPFMSLGLGDVLIRCSEQSPPPILPWRGKGRVTAGAMVAQDTEYCVWGLGGLCTCRIIAAHEDKTIDVYFYNAAFGNGVLLERAVEASDQSSLASNVGRLYVERSSSSCICLDANHDEVVAHVTWERVLPRLQMHRHVLSGMTSPNEAFVEEFIKCFRSLIRVPGRSEDNSERHGRYVIAELTVVVPRELLVALEPGATSLLSSESYDLLSLAASLKPVASAVRVWELLAMHLVEALGTHTSVVRWMGHPSFPVSSHSQETANHRSYIPPAKTFKKLLSYLARSVRSHRWIAVVEKVVRVACELRQKDPAGRVDAVDFPSFLASEWFDVGIKNGCGLIYSHVGGSARRGTARAQTAHVAKPGLSLEARAKILDGILAAPDGVSAACLWSAMQILDVQSSYATERTAHRREGYLMDALLNNHRGKNRSAVSDANKCTLSRWLLAVGICNALSPSSTEETDALKRLTFLEVESMYVLQWCIAKVRRRTLPLGASMLISSFLA